MSLATQVRKFQLGHVLYKLMTIAAGPDIAGKCTGMLFESPDEVTRAPLLSLNSHPWNPTHLQHFTKSTPLKPLDGAVFAVKCIFDSCICTAQSILDVAQRAKQTLLEQASEHGNTGEAAAGGEVQPFNGEISTLLSSVTSAPALSAEEQVRSP